jgi:DNA-binding MarR family transcriptional regulator
MDMETDDVAQLIERISAVTVALHRLVSEVAGQSGMTSQQAGLLRSLEQPRSMSALAAERNCDPSNITGLVDRLQRLGLVERRPDPADRRIRLLALTPAGRRMRASIRRDVTKEVQTRWHLDVDDLPTVLDALDRLIEASDPELAATGR